MSKFAPICLVAETIEKHKSSSMANRTLEFAEKSYFTDVKTALEKIGRDVVHFEHPKMIIEHVNDLRGTTIVSLWSGEESRSRRALVGSICEAGNLRYLGADAYTAIVCQDKQLSKSYAARFGISAPQAIVLEEGDQLPSIPPFNGPFVVKPLLEGGSIGIDENSLCKSWQDVANQYQRLCKSLGGALMIEEFIEGDEISICLLGTRGQEALLGAVQLSIPGYDIPKGIWSLELKKNRKLIPTNIDIADQISQELELSCRQLFESFEKVDFMRIDGRLTSKGFKLIELTPDVHMGPNAAYASSMYSQGLSYEGMWDELLSVAECDS